LKGGNSFKKFAAFTVNQIILHMTVVRRKGRTGTFSGNVNHRVMDWVERKVMMTVTERSVMRKCTISDKHLKPGLFNFRTMSKTLSF
jgi:polyisoprenoid-binding protein YceI